MGEKFEVYDIFTDTMKEITVDVLGELQEVHRAYGRIRATIQHFEASMEEWDDENWFRDQMKLFIIELNQVHQELKNRLGACEALKGPNNEPA